MSWQDHGPGTLEWDVMFGTNHTGLYPNESHFILERDGDCSLELQSATFTRNGHGWSTEIDNTWQVESISTKYWSLPRRGNFTLKAKGDDKVHTFRVNRDFKSHDNTSVVVDLID